jgi:hypothetical protein
MPQHDWQQWIGGSRYCGDCDAQQRFDRRPARVVTAGQPDLSRGRPRQLATQAAGSERSGRADAGIGGGMRRTSAGFSDFWRECSAELRRRGHAPAVQDEAWKAWRGLCPRARKPPRGSSKRGGFGPSLRRPSPKPERQPRSWSRVDAPVRFESPRPGLFLVGCVLAYSPAQPMPAHHVRDRIISLLQGDPDGIATLVMFDRLGASTAVQRQAISHSLSRMAANGLVHRSGVGLAAVWTLVPNAAPPPGGGRSGGATELARARDRAVDLTPRKL